MLSARSVFAQLYLRQAGHYPDHGSKNDKGLSVAHGSQRKHEYLPLWESRGVSVSELHIKKSKESHFEF